MRVALRTFTTTYDGERVVVTAGERVEDGHPIVAAHPDAFRDFTPDELEIRSARVRELAVAPRYQTGASAIDSAAALRAREQQEFDSRMLDMMIAERDGGESFDPIFELAERAAIEQGEHDLAQARELIDLAGLGDTR